MAETTKTNCKYYINERPFDSPVEVNNLLVLCSKGMAPFSFFLSPTSYVYFEPHGSVKLCTKRKKLHPNFCPRVPSFPDIEMRLRKKKKI